MPFVENLGTGGGSLDAQYGDGTTPGTFPLLLDPTTSGPFVYTPGSAGNYVAVPHSDSLNILGTEGTKFLSLPGSVTQYAFTPGVSALAITGDIDIRVRVALDDWTAATNQTLMSKWSGGVSGQAFYFDVRNTSGRLLFEWYTSGGADIVEEATAAPTVADGAATWVRVTLDVDNGAGQYEVKFWQSNDGSTWSQVGLTKTGTTGVTNIQSTTSIMEIGTYLGGGGAPAAGKVYRAQVRDGIDGTVVFDADFTQQAIGSRGFIESTGKLVSVVGLFGNAAQIVDGTTYGTMPSTSVAGGWTTPDSAALDVSDFNAVARVSLNDWNGGPDETILSKWHAPSGQVSYRLFVQNGRLTVSYSVGGVGQPGLDWGATTPFVNGQTYWLRWSRNATTGDWRFDYAADSETEPTAWTNVGGNVAGTAGALTNSTANTTIGAYNNDASGEPAQGRMYRAIIRNANTGGTKVLDADFTRQIQFASTFTEGSSNLATVTTQGAARIERDRDLDLRVKVAMDDWTPAGNQILLSRWAPGQYSYLLLVAAGSGQVQFGYSPTGAIGQVNFVGSGIVPFGDGLTRWVRLTADVNNSANGHTFSFFTSQDGATWTPLGSPVTLPGAVSIFPGTRPLEIGAEQVSSGPVAGKFYEAEIRNGINGPAVLDLDFSTMVTTGSETAMESSGPGSPTIPEALQYLPNLGWGGTGLNARFGSAVGADTNDPLLLDHTGTNYLYLPGVAGNSATTPDAAPLDITGDHEIVVRAALDNWTSSSADQALVGKNAGGNSGANCSPLGVRVSTTGFLIVQPAVGGVVYTFTSTVPIPFSAGQVGWVKATLQLNNGSNSEVRFYIAPDSTSEPVSWTQLGDVRTAAIIPVLETNAQPLAVGQEGNSSRWATGKFYRAIVRNGIGGTVVFDANFSTGITSGSQTTFTESSSNAATVTINRSTSGRKSVAVVQDVLLFGTDDYLEVPDNDLLDFTGTEGFTVAWIGRQWNNTAATHAYVTKRESSGSFVGYNLQPDGATAFVVGNIDDGADGLQPDPSPVSIGNMNVLGFTVDRSTQQMASFSNGTPGTPASSTPLGSLVNAINLRIGTTYALPTDILLTEDDRPLLTEDNLTIEIE